MIKQRKRLLRKRRIAPGVSKANPGSSPGILHHSPMHLPTRVSVTAYGPEGYVEHEDVRDLQQIDTLMKQWPVVWIGVNGLQDLQLIEKLGDMFSLDKLLLEDVLDVGHRPKLDVYEHMIFSVLKGATHTDQLETEQISLFVKKNVVIVFQEKSSRRFHQVRDRVRHGTGKIRHNGTDYLFYALLDEVIDRYFPILDKLNETLLGIEDKIFGNSNQSTDADTIQNIHHAKTDLLVLHRIIWPMIDMVNVLLREDTVLITKNTRGYLKDCYDHSQQANDLSQFYRDTATGLLNTYLAYEGHKTNEIIKVLTMVSAVFIPLTLVASIFGMNFENPVPSYSWHYGFGFAIGLMIVLAFFMIVYFNKKGWIPMGWPVNRAQQALKDVFDSGQAQMMSTEVDAKQK
jgi:magnesium transporter